MVRVKPIFSRSRKRILDFSGRFRFPVVGIARDEYKKLITVIEYQLHSTGCLIVVQSMVQPPQNCSRLQ